MLEKHVTADSSLGINPYSSDWKLLAERLLAMSEQLKALDVGGYDLNALVRDFCHEFPRFYCDFFGIPYDSEYGKNIIACVYATYHPLLALGEDIFITEMMASGHWATSLFNTILNSMLHRSSWKAITNAVGVFDDYDQHNVLTVFGDDSDEATSAKMLPIYSGPIIQKFYAEKFHLEITDSTKNKVVADSAPYTDTLFLQRYFRPEGGLMFAPLNKEVLRHMVMYVNKSDNFHEAVYTNVHNALREWSLWSEEDFEREKAHLNKYLRIMNPTYQFFETYAEARARHLSCSTSS
jgi:hypothetical protein